MAPTITVIAPEIESQIVAPEMPDSFTVKPRSRPKELVATTVQYFRDYGLVRTAFRVNRFLTNVTGLGVSRASIRLLRQWLRPSLSDILAIGVRIHSSVEPFLGELFPEFDWHSFLPSYYMEHESILEEIRVRLGSTISRYPPVFSIGPSSSLALYSVARRCAPRVLIETGVANGASTLVLLRALEGNGSGKLFSIDTSARAGDLVRENERAGWTLLELNRENPWPRRSLRKLLSEVGPADVALHDSDHTYSWQLLEYEELLQKVRPSGVLFSDDVHLSFAFIDLCKRFRLKPSFLIDGTRLFGACRVPSLPSSSNSSSHL